MSDKQIKIINVADIYIKYLKGKYDDLDFHWTINKCTSQ